VTYITVNLCLYLSLSCVFPSITSYGLSLLTNDDIIINLHCLLIKVQFEGTSTPTAVETQGILGSNSYYVTQYRLKISLDCATFQPILNAIGNNEVVSVKSKCTLFLLFIYYCCAICNNETSPKSGPKQYFCSVQVY